MLCPSCSYDNIEGMDRCANCMTPLRSLDIPRADAATGVVRSVMEDELSDLPRREALTVPVTDSVSKVVRRMNEAGVSVVLVEEQENRLAGFFTERDAVHALIEGRGEMPIGEIVTRDVMPLSATHSVAHALSRMTIENSRYVVLEDANGSHAVVSSTDVLNYIADKDW